MDGSVLDAIVGKHYNLLPFENSLVKVEAAGDVIRVGIKDETGNVFSWWEPRYPFTPPHCELPKHGKWTFVVEAPDEHETRAIFTFEEDRCTLTLTCTDPSADPKPIELNWHQQRVKEKEMK